MCVNWLYMVRGLLDNTIYDRISDSPPFREQTPPANDPGTVAGLDFDYSKAETDDEYRKRRIKMAGHHPWIVKMWQADLLGESKRDETRCMSSAGIHEPDEQIELAAAAKASMEKEFSRQRSWDDNRSDTSEAPSDWGSIESSTVEGSGEGTSEGETLQGQLGDLGEILTVEAPDGDDEQQLVSEAPHN